MGIQNFMTLSEEWLKDHFVANNGSTNTTTLILQDCGQQPDQDFLTFMQ
jgi:hypothetical protein